MNISSVAKTTAIPSSLNQSNRTSEPIPSSTQSDSVSISPEAFAASNAAVGSQSPSSFGKIADSIGKDEVQKWTIVNGQRVSYVAQKKTDDLAYKALMQSLKEGIEAEQASKGEVQENKSVVSDQAKLQADPTRPIADSVANVMGKNLNLLGVMASA